MSSPAAVGVQVKHGIVFAETSTGPLLLDLYLPDAPRPAPIVVWLHGGGWFTGDRTLCPDLRSFAADRGIAMASIEYRLSGDAIFPAQLHDVRAAIRYLRRSSGELGLNGNAIGVWGASAGGHLAALAGLTGHIDALPGETAEGDASVQAVAESYGPVDLLGSDVPVGAGLPGLDVARSPEARLIGGIPAEHPDRALAADPRTYLTAQAPPFQISHGTGDHLVPHRHSELLHKSLVEAGCDSELFLVDGYRHGFLNPAGRMDVAMAGVMDDGRLAAEVSAPAQHFSGTNLDGEQTRFGFGTVLEFFYKTLGRVA